MKCLKNFEAAVYLGFVGGLGLLLKLTVKGLAVNRMTTWMS